MPAVDVPPRYSRALGQRGAAERRDRGPARRSRTFRTLPSMPRR
jgi:hypothetical protein